MDLRRIFADSDTIGISKYLSSVLEKTLLDNMRSCIGCNNWNEEKEVCGHYNNLRPPARIIAFGCADFCNDVPF